MGEVGQDQRDSLIALAVRRNELVAAAQADRFHWRLLLKPAELIDFDLLALGLAAMSGGTQGADLLFEATADRGPAARLPFDAARDLMGGN